MYEQVDFCRDRFTEGGLTMTDKELRKLSRLELLEVLLEESKENEKLRKALVEKFIYFTGAKGRIAGNNKPSCSHCSDHSRGSNTPFLNSYFLFLPFEQLSTRLL